MGQRQRRHPGEESDHVDVAETAARRERRQTDWATIKRSRCKVCIWVLMRWNINIEFRFQNPVSRRLRG